MRKISLCLEPVMPELSIYDRIKAAADAGYKSSRVLGPFGLRC